MRRAPVARSPRAHPRAVAVLAVAVGLTGCRREVARHLDEAQAGRVVATLAAAGIAAERQAEPGPGATFAVRVARGDAAAALAALGADQQPRRSPPGLAEVFGRPGLVPSPTEERARLSRALAGELTATLESIAGVVAARVHLVAPSLDPLDPSPGPASRPAAAVLLTVRGAAGIGQDDVRRLVAGAVPGLDAAAVTVVEVAAAPRPPAAAPRSPVALHVALGVVALLAAALAALGVYTAALARRLRREPGPTGHPTPPRR